MSLRVIFAGSMLLLAASATVGCMSRYRPGNIQPVDNDRMVYPSDVPSDRPFVAVRADGSVIEDLSSNLEDSPARIVPSRTGRLVAPPVVESASPVVPPPAPLEDTTPPPAGNPGQVIP